MAAKRAALFDPALVIGLARVQPALAAWRQRRRHREAIPENLWRLVVPLAQSHGVSPVARALRLNYLALQQRTLAGHVLAAVVRVLSADWQALYHHPIYLLETFIEPAFHAGPSRCESDHGHFQCGVRSAECGMRSGAPPRCGQFRTPHSALRTPHSEFRTQKVRVAQLD